MKLTLQTSHKSHEANPPLALEALGLQDRLHLGEGFADVVVDHDVVVLGPVAHLVAGATHPLSDDLVGVLRTRVQPLLEIAGRGRQDEHADDVGPRFLAQLLRALPVDVEQHILPGRQRGFNQAALLADLIETSSSVPSRQMLERIRYTTTQTAYDRAERMENLHGAFRLRKNRDVRDLLVLLIDDVLTTGSTLSECARVLRNAGAVSVHAATAARA